MDFNKVPPHDLEAEQAVIGSMLTDKDAVISAIEVLWDYDFYREDNKIIYSAILNLYNRGEPIDIITLKENKEKIEEILTNKTNIVEMDEWLGGIDGERQEK